jgi:hypothetical protein
MSTSSVPIVDYEWVSPQTGKPVDEEWHIILKYMYDNYPTAYTKPQDIIDKPFLLRDEIAWGVSDPMFDAAEGSGTVSVNNNNSPNFRVELAGRVRTRYIYVQVEFNYRSFSEGSNTDLLTNGQTIFNRTKRKIEGLLTWNPKILLNQGLTFINTQPTVVQDGRMFTNFGMVGTLQPAFLETLQDDSKWRYILLFNVESREMLV